MNRRLCNLLLGLALAVSAVAPSLAHDSSDRRDRAELVVFGDSLSDPGNFYAVYHQVSQRPFAPIPDAPYAIGGMHYSNGATWVEQLARTLHAGDSAEAALGHERHASNYAVGRARARAGAAEFPYYDLGTQVGIYLSEHGNRVDADALHILWIGANDVKDALSVLAAGGGSPQSQLDAQGIVLQAIGATAGNIQSLWAAGARRFLLVDMPDLSITPFVRGLGPTAQFVANQLSAGYNAGLGQMVAALGALPGIDIRRYDVAGALAGAEVGLTPTRIQDFNTPCLRFGVTEDAVCDNPGSHLFWDAIHPTRAGHAVIAAGALEALNAP